MNPRYDVPVPGDPDDGTLMLEVREALDRAAQLHAEPDVDVHEPWSLGRRRRARKRAGAALVAGAATVTALAVGWQAGLMGGATDPTPTVAAVPDGYTTFVFAAPGAPEVDVDTVSALDVPTAAELSGTTWVLTDDLWGSDLSASQVVAADPGTTTITFGGDPGSGWGFSADGCGGGWVQEDLSLSAEGRFPPSDPVSDDQGCPQDAQAAEDFWAAALGGGGYLRVLGDDDWLLVSVVAPTAGPDDDEGPGVVTVTASPTAPAPTAEPAPSVPSTPAEPSQPLPTQPPPSPEPSASAPPEPPSAPTGTVDPPDEPGATGGGLLPGFVPAGSATTSAGFPGGGALFAPTVRAGANDGFDRVVVDLTGTGAPTWRAAYPPEPVRDGSGLPAGVAGDAVLEVVITGMAYPEPGDPVYDGGDFGLDTHALGLVVEVIRTPPFEGQLQLFVGMTGEPRPYRVFLLQDPMRLVVDVQTAP
ncbi:AMIN-like domain-containing (lipo)protein [Ornithinimicrobium cerasi]|uniref:AMIN-like domain-containing (lipo)protein n=1 Tax=Ornithinimicrobium cerasi TaxID=2248773 RepID=UPI00192A298A|nr:hypothetical protein [Ornithinimicrobium cerasi]